MGSRSESPIQSYDQSEAVMRGDSQKNHPRQFSKAILTVE